MTANPPYRPWPSFVPGFLHPSLVGHPDLPRLDAHPHPGLLAISRPGDRAAQLVEGRRITAPMPYVGEPRCYTWIMFALGAEPIYAVGPVEMVCALTAHPDPLPDGRPRCRDGLVCRATPTCPPDVLYGATRRCVRFPRAVLDAHLAAVRERIDAAEASQQDVDVLRSLHLRELHLVSAVQAWDGWGAARPRLRPPVCSDE